MTYRLLILVLLLKVVCLHERFDGHSLFLVIKRGVSNVWSRTRIMHTKIRLTKYMVNGVLKLLQVWVNKGKGPDFR